jgi:stage IV sporulation protein FA
METKEHVRQRRNERIRELQERGKTTNRSKADIENRFPQSNSSNEISNWTEQHPDHADHDSSEWRNNQLPIIEIEAESELIPYSDERLEDPEYVWNEKIKREFSAGSRNGPDRFRPDRQGMPTWPSSPRYHRNSRGGGRFPTIGKFLGIRMIISIALFGVVWGMSQFNQAWAVQGQKMVSEVLFKPFDYRAAAAWYARTFSGAPSFIPTFDSKNNPDAVKVNSGQTQRTYFTPVEGHITLPFDGTHTGILIQTKADTPVNAMDAGQVVSVSNKTNTEITVVIRHPEGVETTYGFIQQCRVEEGDWIKGGETIGLTGKAGTHPDGTLYFAVNKDNQMLNPADVVALE